MASVRRFIRHPSDVPISVHEQCQTAASDEQLEKFTKINNVSLGGLAFFSPVAFQKGQELSISIPCINKQHELKGSVLWCKKKNTGFEIGLQFMDPNAIYQLRMIEQICHIEHYRKEVERVEKRQLSSEEAALEWIKLYAADFPKMN